MIYNSAKEWREAPAKRVLLFGMSGLGKTYLSNALRASGSWFHYSIDYRIGTRYMGELIVDNAKRHAMQVPFLRRFQESMADAQDLESLEATLRANLATLETLAAEITRRAARRLYGTDADLAVDPMAVSLEAASTVTAPAETSLAFDPAIAADLDRAWFADDAIGVLGARAAAVGG